MIFYDYETFALDLLHQTEKDQTDYGILTRVTQCEEHITCEAPHIQKKSRVKLFYIKGAFLNVLAVKESKKSIRLCLLL